MRFLSIDLGDKRTGLAVGDDLTGVVTPLHTLQVPITERAGDALLDALTRAIDEQFSPHSAAALVVGLPYNMDGTEGPRAALVRDFAARLAARLNPPRDLHFHDERLTTAEADWQMSRSGRTRAEKKNLRDSLAAAALLRDFLSSRNA